MFVLPRRESKSGAKVLLFCELTKKNAKKKLFTASESER